MGHVLRLCQSIEEIMDRFASWLNAGIAGEASQVSDDAQRYEMLYPSMMGPHV